MTKLKRLIEIRVELFCQLNKLAKDEGYRTFHSCPAYEGEYLQLKHDLDNVSEAINIEMGELYANVT